jgi:hypothetical protein
VKGLQASAHHPCDLQADGIGADINRGECGHDSRCQHRNRFSSQTRS